MRGSTVITSHVLYWLSGWQVEEQREWKEGGKNEANGDDTSEDDAAVDDLVIYRQILEILKPGETVVKVCTCHIMSLIW